MPKFRSEIPSGTLRGMKSHLSAPLLPVFALSQLSASRFSSSLGLKLDVNRGGVLERLARERDGVINVPQRNALAIGADRADRERHNNLPEGRDTELWGRMRF